MIAGDIVATNFKLLSTMCSAFFGLPSTLLPDISRRGSALEQGKYWKDGRGRGWGRGRGRGRGVVQAVIILNQPVYYSRPLSSGSPF